MEKEKSFREKIADMLSAQALGLARAAGWGASTSAPPGVFSVANRLRATLADIQRLALWNDPRGMYAHCLCGED